MKNKKEKLVVILLVVGLIVMTVAISYAAFRFTQTGSVLNQITTGSITMSYTESSNVISMTGALPTTDATGKIRLNEGEYFDFTVGSSITGTANINYEIAAQELDGNTIDGSYIKYYLTKVNDDSSEEEVMAPTTYTEETSSNEYTGRPANMMSLYTGSMSASTTTKYRLRLYVDESYNPQGDGGNLVYKVRVNVYGLTGAEIEETLAPGLYKEDGTFVSWEELLQTKVSVKIWDADNDYMSTKTIETNMITVENGILKSYHSAMGGDEHMSDYDFFSGCDLIIEEGVTTISGEQTFYDSEISSITFPKSLTKIEIGSFEYTHVSNINYCGTVEEWKSVEVEQGWNFGVTIDMTVHCVDGDVILPADPDSI